MMPRECLAVHFLIAIIPSENKALSSYLLFKESLIRASLANNYSSLLTIMCEPGDLFRNFIRFFIAGVS